MPKDKQNQIPKYVYTANNSKQDGLLVITDKDWDEFAKSRDCRIVKGNYGNRLLVDKDIKLTKKQIEDVEDDNAAIFNVWFLNRTEVKVDKNLSEVVSW